MTALLTRAEVEALPDLGPWHVACCPSHSPGGKHYSPSYPAPSCLAVRSDDEKPVRANKGFRAYLDLQAAAPDLRATALALYVEVARQARHIKELDDIVKAYEDGQRPDLTDEVGGKWPSDLGPPLRCGTLLATPPLKAPAASMTLEWRDLSLEWTGGPPGLPDETQKEQPAPSTGTTKETAWALLAAAVAEGDHVGASAALAILRPLARLREKV